jgi:AraC-like DNA-binding protein
MEVSGPIPGGPFAANCEGWGDGVGYGRLAGEFDVQANPLIAHQLLYIADWRAEYFTRRHGLESYLVFFTTDGRGELAYRGRTTAQTPGSAFWIDCREPHEYRTKGASWSGVGIHFEGGTSKFYWDAFQAGTSPLIVNTAAVVDTFPTVRADTQVGKLRTLVDAMCFALWSMPNMELHMNRVLTELLTELLLRPSVDGSTHDGPVEQGIRYVMDHYRQHLTLDELAERVHLSKYHLARGFKEATGMPPIEYQLHLRVEAARQLLIHSDFSVSRVSSLVGFETDQQFRAAFRKRTGLSPSAFRKHWLG